MSDIEVHLEGVEEGTYEIVTGNFTKLVDNQDDENGVEATEYLDLDMEVVEGISDNTDYYSTVDESQDDINFHKRTIVTQQAYLTTNDESFDSDTVRKSQRLKRKHTKLEQNYANSPSIMKVIVPNGTNGNQNIIQLNRNVEEKTVESNPNILPVDSSLSKINQRVNRSLNGTSYDANNDDDDNNVDIFFRSMAHSVLHLPPQVQAKIKMDICKVISMAEIKYCTSKTQNLSKN